jgi:hypothetical protein
MSFALDARGVQPMTLGRQSQFADSLTGLLRLECLHLRGRTPFSTKQHQLLNLQTSFEHLLIRISPLQSKPLFLNVSASFAVVSGTASLGWDSTAFSAVLWRPIRMCYF